MAGSRPPVSPTDDHAPFEDTERPLALLVDGDNAAAATISRVLEEAAKYGTVIVRRVYGDWTSPQLGSWKKVLQDHALSPAQQFANVSGKNATDSSLIIDAMDILHSGKVNGFCIVSSDSDYTRLATRIREEGSFVMGVGRANTPPAFRNACNVFVAVENIIDPGIGSAAPEVGAKEVTAGRAKSPSGSGASKTTPPATEKVSPTKAREIIRRAFDTVAKEDGSAHLGRLGAALLKLDPAFDPRTYGCSRLLTLIQQLPNDFEVERPADLSDPRILVRLRALG